MTPGKHSHLWSPPGQGDLPAIPVRTLHGAQPGPHLLATGGVHGDEYEGPAALEQWFAALDPARLAGRITTLPVVNVAAWSARQRRTPADDSDLNRAFPGDPAGGPTARLAFAVWQEFIIPADAVIDLHSGGIAFRHLPLAGVYAGAGDQARRLRSAFDARFRAWLIPDARGVLSREAHHAGKIAAGIEWGGGGALDPAGVAALVDALNRCLGLLGLSTDPQPSGSPDTQPPVGGDYETAPAAGIFSASVPLGIHVAVGDRIGTLINPFTGVTTAVAAQRAGQIAGLAHRAWLDAGDRIAYLG
ncbi:MAG: succinylglutamate desuccinylase/aspartoacylase family protein [Opitutaceae bacterium]|nr:succinylglutamate desuccinylase/aspartoacylase family protein [Opitutaceae bacterium]